MIVVAIIGVTSALAAPAIGRWQSDQKARDRAIAAANLFNEARALARVHAVSYVVEFTPADRANHGGFAAYRTDTGSDCDLPGVTVGACDGDDTDGDVCVGEVRGNGGGADKVFVRYGRAGNNCELGICFMPDGQMMYRTSPGDPFLPAARTGLNHDDSVFEFRFFLSEDGGANAVNVSRTVLVPLGGIATVSR